MVEHFEAFVGAHDLFKFLMKLLYFFCELKNLIYSNEGVCALDKSDFAFHWFVENILVDVDIELGFFSGDHKWSG